LQKLRDDAATGADPTLLDYVNKKNEMADSVSAENLPQAAFAALPAAEQILPTFHWYQLITNVFLHGGIMHLAGNLIFLLVIGSRVNALLGQLFTGILYFVLGILASGAYYLSSMHPVQYGPALGASGAIMGMAGLFLIFFPVGRIYMVFWIRFGFIAMFRRYTKIWAPRGFWVLLFFIAFDVVATLLGSQDGTAHWAHLGGFISGMVIGLALLLSRQVDAGGGDILSALLGRRAWALIGKPIARMQAAADLPAVPAVRAMDLNFHE
jgi:membrane associated rhomboid family serine protease